jgi:alkyl hydroperoxide reductase subunit AhpC
MFRRALAATAPRMSGFRAFSATAPRLCYGYEAMQTASVQKPAPGWTATAVVDGAFKDVSLADYKGKYVVMLFYPLDFTFVCPTEITAFSDRAGEFEKIGAQVLAISVDSQFSHLAWTKQPRKEGGLGEMKIPLVADLTKDIARDYGVLIEDKGIALRGLFIIDGNGVLRSMTVNDLPVGRSVDETLRVVQGFQYSDEHGEVVPCNWTPGKPTIDTKKAQEFFSKNN